MSSEVQVFPVTCRREIKHFIKFPYTLYKDYPNWVPPLIKERMDFLNPKKNPFFKNARVKLF
ncbi:MAG: N-acetyltransferase, partial [Thermodesulfobacteriota bacterium]|nr:N-acetyltransferase [Thermodesulfobacteriota bacterium]